ncbi:MAG: DUF192 domain-containing protein [Candidatus Caenarcaniphilales bacterium]|nr:DUF192 domain-containing protein [Candidatus Caenarcaniphilales bacterium]
MFRFFVKEKSLTPNPSPAWRGEEAIAEGLRPFSDGVLLRFDFLVFYFVCCFLCVGLHSCAFAKPDTFQNKTPHEVAIPKTRLHKIRFKTLEIAERPQELQTGLMNRKSLCDECAMLFVFPEPGVFPFWMKNTFIPLDITFISENGKIIDVFENAQPLNDGIQYWPRAKAKYVLETKAGFARQNNFSEGDKINLKYLLKKGITAYQFPEEATAKFPNETNQ